MRVLRVGLLALVAAPIATAASGGVATDAGCASPSGITAPRLPAPVTITTRAGSFRVGRDGRVCRRALRTNLPEGAETWPTLGLWLRNDARGHLVIGRRHRTLLTSRAPFPHAYEVGTIAVARRELAFSYGGRVSHLYIARLGGPERRVGLGYPLGWTRRGLYVGRGGAVFLLRGGSQERLPGAAVRTAAYDDANRALYYVSHGRLFRASGLRSKSLAALSRLGFARRPRWLQVLLLGRLIALETAERLVVLRPNGSLLASTRLRLRAHSSDQLSDEPVASPSGREIAFTILRPLRRIVEQRIERGVETVYVLRPGDRSARRVYSDLLRFNVCGHGATLAWHGGWLLYSVGEGPAALIDTTGGRAIGLSSVVRRVPGFSGVEESGPLSLAWS